MADAEGAAALAWAQAERPDLYQQMITATKGIDAAEDYAALADAAEGLAAVLAANRAAHRPPPD